jgi:hypothetical protein
MVTIAPSLAALPPDGPQVPLVPSNTTASAPQTQFKDIYQNIPDGGHNESETGSRQKSVNPKDGAAKKTDNSDANQKTAPSVTAHVIQPAAQKNPFILAAPSLGLETQVRETAPETGAETTSGDGQQQSGTHLATPRQAAGGSSIDLPAASGVFTRTVSAATDLPLPRINTLAFSVRLHSPDVSATQVPAQAKPAAPRVQTPNQLISPAIRDTKPSSTLVPSGPALRAEDSAEPAKRTIAEPTALQSHALLAASATESQSSSLAYESPAQVHDLSVAAIRDVGAAPEAPKTPAASEILLHLASHDQSAAAVRVIERAGTVSVAVHAPDANLRESLRSNLGDLTTQLNGQGFRTEVVKPTTVAAHADNAQDSRHDGQRSLSQQQQTATGERNTSRQRRTNADRWEEELEKDTAGDASSDGGTN